MTTTTAPAVACEPCGMPLHVHDIVAHSPAWHRIHKERHVAAFPRLDGRTIRALNDCIRYAEEAAR